MIFLASGVLFLKPPATHFPPAIAVGPPGGNAVVEAEPPTLFITATTISSREKCS